MIVTTKEDGGNLFTEKEYADFTLRFEVKLISTCPNTRG